MSAQPEHTGSGEALHPDIAGLAAGSLLSGAIESVQCTAGEIIVVRVSGEVDLCTIPILAAALDASLDQYPAHLIVDLARMAFCSVRGLDLLTETGRIAAATATGYAVTGVSPQIQRVWTVCWGSDRPICYLSTAAAVLGIWAAESGVQVPTEAGPGQHIPTGRFPARAQRVFPRRLDPHHDTGTA